MPNSPDHEQVKERTIELKVSEDADSDQRDLPVDSEATNSLALLEQSAAADQREVEERAVDKRKVAKQAVNKREVDEREVEELLRKPESDDFLHVIEQLSPDEIAHLLNKLNRRNNRYTRYFRQLTEVPEEPRTAISIIGWWEARRIVFNLLVGLAGLPTVLFIGLFTSASFYFIVEGVVAYAIAANVCYTAGCVSEILVRRWWAERAKHFGPMLLTLGLLFSIAITLLALVYWPLVTLWTAWMMG